VAPRVPYLREAVQEHHRPQFTCHKLRHEHERTVQRPADTRLAALAPRGTRICSQRPRSRGLALTFADLSDVEVDPAGGDVGVLDLLVRH
jgi:hypothetical protein